MKKPLEENGIHRAKTWEIACYAANNVSTNTYLMLVSYISYYLIGIVGVGAVLAGSIITIMRVWDGVTDPFVGFVVDKTNGRFGKNRPFLVIGQGIMFVTTWLMYNVITNVSVNLRFPLFILFYLIYIVGYTFQCVVTKSAQTCITNDPKQRPMFAIFDSVYNVLLMSVFIPMYVTDTLVPKYNLNMAHHGDHINSLIAQNPNLANVLTEKDGVQVLSAFYNPAMYQEMQLGLGALSFVLMVLAVIGLWRKDNTRYYGTGKTVRIRLRDYVETLSHNRAIQMLVVSASTDKLASQMFSNATVRICLFGVIMGSYPLYSSFSQLTAIPICLVSIIGLNQVARKRGQKMSMLVGSIGGLVGAGLILVLFYFGTPLGATLPQFRLLNPTTWGTLFHTSNYTFFGVAFLLLYIFWQGMTKLSGSIVITMTADCADYEVYRSGKYVPGLMGTLFSFVDTLISSLATTIVALVYAVVGFGQALPTQDTPFSTGLFWATMICYLGAPCFGWICNLIAMKFYPLTKSKMAEIQDEIARIKAEYSSQAANN